MLGHQVWRRGYSGGQAFQMSCWIRVDRMVWRLPVVWMQYLDALGGDVDFHDAGEVLFIGVEYDLDVGNALDLASTAVPRRVAGVFVDADPVSWEGYVVEAQELGGVFGGELGHSRSPFGIGALWPLVWSWSLRLHAVSLGCTEDMVRAVVAAAWAVFVQRDGLPAMTWGLTPWERGPAVLAGAVKARFVVVPHHHVVRDVAGIAGTIWKARRYGRINPSPAPR